jgi:hypothetical protein
MDTRENNNENLLATNLCTKPESSFEKAETDLIKDALERTYMERLLFTTRLYKIQQTLKKALITHQPYLPAKSK